MIFISVLAAAELFRQFIHIAGVAELVDAPDLGSGVF